MNDDFLKKHRVRPNSDLVESITQRLENETRRTDMFANKLRPAVLTLIALVGVFALTFAVSPAVRAAVQSILIFNGVEVGINDETGELVVTGNTDAVVYQDETTVMIQSEDAMMLEGVSVHSDEAPVSVDELESIAPDFTMPTDIPTGYALSENAFVYQGMVSVLLENADGQWVGYSWGQPPVIDLPLPEEGVMIDMMGEGVEIEELPPEMVEEMEGMMEPYLIVPGMDGEQLAILSAELDGVPVQISTNDLSLTEDDLRAIIPYD